MKSIFQALVLTLFSLVTTQTFSQNANLGGTINGTITDASGELLGGIVVFIDSTSKGQKGAMSDFDGHYEIKDIPEGTYHVRFSGIGYHTQLIAGVTVKSGQKPLLLNVVLETSFVMDSVVEIRDIRASNSISFAVDSMHHEDKAVNVMSGAQIAKSQDRDAAEVVKRIPGVTIIENRFIMVRGLNERYNNVWLNDAGAPSMETDKRAFSFDMIPSGMVDRILVYKTPSPELPADFAGGMVKIYTKSFPEKTYLSVNYQTSFRSGTTGKTFYYTPGSSTDKFGFDNGYRSVPAGTPEYFNRNGATTISDTKSFHNDWAILDKNALPDQRFSFMYAVPFHLKNGMLMGNTFGVSYSNVLTNYSIRRQDWDSITQLQDYADLQTTQTIRTNAIENFSWIFGTNRLEFKNLINQQGRSWVTQRESNFLLGPNEKAYSEGYESRLIYSSQLCGDHKSKTGRTQYTWAGGFGYTERDAPDLRRIKYTKQRIAPDSMYSAQVANSVDPINGGGRFYAWQNERVFSFNQNFRHTFFIGHSDSTHTKYRFDINVGTYTEYKSRQFIARVLGYTIAPGQLAFDLKRLPIDQIFSEEHVGTPGAFFMDEITSKSDKYQAQNLQMAGYVSVGLPIGKKIKIVGGTRYEYNEQALQSYVNQDSVNPKVVTRFILPSVNATYNFNEKALVRLAYGKTLNRPEFREWSPFYFYDFDFSAGTYGSLYPTLIAQNGQILKVAQVDNYDCRFEFYPGQADYVQIGYFYKAFRDPIQQVVLVSQSDGKSFTYTNADYAFTNGIEFDMRKNLAFLDTAFNTKAFGNFNLVANFSIIQSKLYISQVVNQATSNPLQGQSPYVVNGGVYYQNDSIGFQASLLYNVFGPRLFLVGTTDYPNIGELPKQSLDLSLSQKVWKSFSLTFSIQDILNQSVRLVQDTNRNGKFESKGDDLEISSFKKGRYFSFGIKLNLTGE